MVTASPAVSHHHPLLASMFLAVSPALTPFKGQREGGGRQIDWLAEYSSEAEMKTLINGDSDGDNCSLYCTEHIHAQRVRGTE